LLAFTDKNDQTIAEEGSVFGTALLLAGTAVGAGMLARPAETAQSGFAPSVVSLLQCWAFTFITSLFVLETSWTVMRDPSKEGSGFLSITRSTLGPVGEIVTYLLFWFLLSSIVIACTSEGRELLSEFVQESLGTSAFGTILSPQIGSAVFMAFFVSLSIFATKRVDINREPCLGVWPDMHLRGSSRYWLPQIDTTLLSRANWGAIYPEVLSIGILHLVHRM
jgi:amino acid permease